MGDEKAIKEKLEYLKKYMYKELNQLKTRILEANYQAEKNFFGSNPIEDGNNGFPDISSSSDTQLKTAKSDLLLKYKPTKHQRMAKRAFRTASNGKWKRLYRDRNVQLTYIHYLH